MHMDQYHMEISYLLIKKPLSCEATYKLSLSFYSILIYIFLFYTYRLLTIILTVFSFCSLLKEGRE